jgi:uncharacterized protein
VTVPERRTSPRTGGESHPFLTAQWRNLIMLHWEVDPKLVIDLVPIGTTLDLWQGKAYVGLVGFQFLDTRVLGAPVPFHQDFEEVNLRFYVRRVVDDEVRHGVVFICECVPRQLVGGMARLLYREPYMVVPMKSVIRADPAPDVQYAWQARNRWCSVSAHAKGASALPQPRTLDDFVTRRPWGYNGRRGTDTLEYHVSHPPWNVWRALDAKVDADLSALCGSELARQLTVPVSALIADGSSVTIYWRTRLL